MEACIGIISYLPDKEPTRSHRITKLIDLIHSCQRLFNVSIIVIAQNWKEFTIDNITKISYSDKLGIVGARKELRRVFLNSSYDTLIMLDDDCRLEGTSGKEYLRQLEDNHDCFIEFNLSLLKLFAISKEIYKQVDFDNINPENEEGFEDRIFVDKLRKLFPDKRRTFTNTGIKEISISTKDVDSTWYTNQDINKMLEKTLNIIN